jgi:hypothetical protein
VIHPNDIGREVTREEFIKYGYKSGQCGGCDQGIVRRAVGRRATRNDDGTITEGYEWREDLCPVMLDRFMRRMEKRLALVEHKRLHWTIGLDPENFWFSMMFAAEMLNYQDRIKFDQYVDRSTWPWRLRVNAG